VPASTATGLTTLTVAPSEYSSSPVSPAVSSYGGDKPNGVSPDVAEYTGAASRNAVGLGALAIMGAVALL
jgi:hypothetical protein